MNRKSGRLLWALAATLFVSWVAPATLAADTPAGATSDERLQLLMQDTIARLKLTPEQQSRLKPLFEDRNQKLRALRDKYDAKSGRRNGRAMFREARQVQEDYEKKVLPILDATQAAEWQKMRQEARDRFKDLQKAGDGPW